MYCVPTLGSYGSMNVVRVRMDVITPRPDLWGSVGSQKRTEPEDCQIFQATFHD